MPRAYPAPTSQPRLRRCRSSRAQVLDGLRSGPTQQARPRVGLLDGSKPQDLSIKGSARFFEASWAGIGRLDWLRLSRNQRQDSPSNAEARSSRVHAFVPTAPQARRRRRAGCRLAPDAPERRACRAGAGTPRHGTVGLRRVFPAHGEGIIPPRPGTLTAPDAHWRRLAPQGAFAWLSMMVPAALTPG